MDTNRINLLLSKITELLQKGNQLSEIDADLMLDYVKVVYADINDLKNKLSKQQAISRIESVHSKEQPIEENLHQELAPNQVDNLSVVEPVIVGVDKKESSLSTTESPIEEVSGDVRRHIGLNDQLLYLNELFAGDKEHMNEILDYINQKSKSTIIHFLNEEFIIKGIWDAEDSTVKLFLALIDQHYANFK